jgi:hypothetical protein
MVPVYISCRQLLDLSGMSDCLLIASIIDAHKVLCMFLVQAGCAATSLSEAPTISQQCFSYRMRLPERLGRSSDLFLTRAMLPYPDYSSLAR